MLHEEKKISNHYSCLELTSINKDVITYFEQRPMLVDVSAEAKGECNINFKLTGTFHANDLTVNALCFTWLLVNSVIIIRPDSGSDDSEVIWSDIAVD